MRKIQDADVKNKKVLLRVDFNSGIEGGDAKEAFKIAAAKETVSYLLEKGAKVALISHLGRPEGKTDPEFSLGQIADDAERIIGIKTKFVDDCIGEKVKIEIGGLSPREMLLLENVRFYPGDETNDEVFAKKLSENFDIFVNDAFSVCHRNQASVTGVAKFLPSFAGLWLQKEVEEMEKVKNNFVCPAVAIVGGAKIETKLPVIKFFEEKYDFVLVGGKIANEAIDQKVNFGGKVVLPFDFVDDRLDVGPKTVEKFKEIIKSAKTIVWNGPMGKFEEEKYSSGTKNIFESIISSGAHIMVGGGETLEILEKNNAMDRVSFVSTGGGAMLEYLSGGKMPGIEALES
ncbi:MAG TPA: phosphoglycerate kinase [Candidatus Moranbacteria bacterium]|nr:phosphoglycerate kinase [Candidatus Moranbacteria bacterium]